MLPLLLEPVTALSALRPVRADSGAAVAGWCWLMVLLQEFSAGHVKGALNLDSTAFTDNALVDNLVEQLQAKSQVGVA
jgi:hypothetical protein